MPLRCIEPITKQNIQAFDLTLDQWRALEIENKRTRHLQMPCCASPVVLKRSKRGTPFFAHKAVGNCRWSPETEIHRRLKQMAVDVARAHGWIAETEVSGVSPSGETWIADVLALRGNHRVAIEIQWSAQTADETLRRQARYAASGIRGLWLLRHTGFPTEKALPAARIGGTPEEGFTAHVPTGTGAQVLPMEDFLAAAFSKRLRFGVPHGVHGRVSVQAGPMSCWSCGSETQIVTEITVQFGPHVHGFSVADLTDYRDLSDVIQLNLPGGLGIGNIKRRHSKTQNRTYLSNGCAHCDALIGEFHKYEAGMNQLTVCEFSVTIDARWEEVVRTRGDPIGWGVYPLNV